MKRRAPVVHAGGQLLVLLLAKDAVGDLVDEEHATLLGELAFDETGADDVDCPHLDVLFGDLQGLGDSGVLDLAARCGGSETGECEEAHLAIQFFAVELLLVNPSLVLVVEVDEVLKILLGEDIQKLGVDGMGVAEGLDARDDAQV